MNRTTKNNVVFISHKMTELSLEEVNSIRAEAMEYIISKFPAGTDIEFIDNYNHPEAPENCNILWHLGRSIQQLGDADYIYFATPIHESKGCIVESLIASLYNLNVLR